MKLGDIFKSVDIDLIESESPVIKAYFKSKDIGMCTEDCLHDAILTYLEEIETKIKTKDKAIVPRTIPQELLDKMRDERVLSPSRVLEMLIEWSEK